MEVYLDNSSTTKIALEVREAIEKVWREFYGNPSSAHRLGFKSEEILEESRKIILRKLNLDSGYRLVFTSGGTEADNLAILGTVEHLKHKGKKIITTQIEHPAVLEPVRYLENKGYNVVYLTVDDSGKIDIENLKREIDSETILVSIMTANNEVGTLQNLEDIRSITESKGILFHTDGVQSFCKVKDNRADMISISSHKIRGPRGIGALALKKNIILEPLIRGGGQESNLRSGTENLEAIVGFAEAVKIASEGEFIDKTHTLRERLKNNILEGLDNVCINGSLDGLPNILNLSFLGTKSEVILRSLEDEGVYVSAGSACSSKNNKGSHVLKAMGLANERIEGAIRFSIGIDNTCEEIDYASKVVIEKVKLFRNLQRFKKF